MLPDPELHVIYLDSRRCKYSLALLEELDAAHDTDSPHALYVRDLKDMDLDDLQYLWIPGVPCFVHHEQVSLGVDAFSKCRQLTRSVDGVRVLFDT